MFVKTHELNNAGAVHPAVVIVRDGRDVCASYARYLVKKHRHNPVGILERVIRGNVPGYRWGDHVLKWRKPRPGQVLLTIRYEEMLRNTEVFNDILILAGIDVDSVRHHKVRHGGFRKLHRSDPDFFHRGGSWWRDAFGDYHEKLFWEIHGDAMRELGYA